MCTQSKSLPIIMSLFSLFVVVVVVVVVASSSNSRTIMMKLVHRETQFSPYNITEHAIRDDHISVSRFKYLSAGDGDIQEQLIGIGNRQGIFYVDFRIGTPSFRVEAIMDTGSSLVWIGCYPCYLCPQESPGLMFNPNKSSTYDRMPCITSCQDCKGEYCTYHNSYADGRNSEGYLSRETFTFDTPSDGITIIPNIVFGCGNKSSELPTDTITGIFGLGMDTKRFPNNIVGQLGNKFSYCVDTLIDPSYAYNHLIIGENAKFEGYTTPISIHSGHYHLTLHKISLGGRALLIDPNLFIFSGLSSVVIDSGTVDTWLKEEAYNVVRKEIQNKLYHLQTYNDDKHAEALCYLGSISKQVQGFSVLTFHFADGAELALGVDSLFSQIEPEAFCLAIRPSIEGGELSIIGMLAQQGYNVGYDLTSNKLFLRKMDCELLGE